MKLGALALAACALWAAYLKLAFVGPAGDAIYYLDPARSFAEGAGVATNILYPSAVASWKGPVAFPAPFVWHGPLAPMAMGYLYRLTGFSDVAPLVYSFGLLLLTGLLCYRFGRDAGGESAGLLATGLLWTNPQVLDSHLGSLTDPMFTFWIAVAASLLWRSRRGSAAAWCALAGAALGLASSSRLAGQVYWIGFTAAAVFLHRSWRPVAALLGALVASMIPVMSYNWRHAGAPLIAPGFYMLQYSRHFPGVSAQTSYFPLSSLQAIFAYPRDFLQKIVTGPLYGINALVEQAQGPYLSVLLLLAAATKAVSREAERLRLMALCIAVPVFAVNLVLANGGLRYLQPLLALMLPLAAAFALRFISRNWPSLAKRPALGLAIFGFIALSPLALELKDLAKTRAARVERQQAIAALGTFLEERTAPGDIIYSDHPPAVAWHARRPSVHLTRTLEDAQKTFERARPAALLLSTLHLHSSDYDEAFRAAFREGRPVLGFSPCERFSAPTLEAVLYRRPQECKPRR